MTGNQRTAQSDDKLLCVRWLAVAPWRGERLGGVRLPITATAICRPGYRGMFACGFHHSHGRSADGELVDDEVPGTQQLADNPDRALVDALPRVRQGVPCTRRRCRGGWSHHLTSADTGQPRADDRRQLKEADR